MRQYATTSDYTTFTGEQTAPANLDRLLRAASRAVDQLMVGYLYSTDAAGMPTNPATLEAFNEATCAIAAAAAHDGLGDPDADPQWQSVAIGNVRLQGPADPDAATVVVAGLRVPAEALLALSSVAGVRLVIQR